VVEVTVERDFEISARRVWDLIADFGDVGWVPGVEKVELEGEGVGMVRHLTVPVYSQIHERLDAIDHEQRVLDYSIPAVEYLHVKNYRARARVVELSHDRCKVIWSCRAEASGADEAQAAASTRAFYESLLTWIRDFLERRDAATAASSPADADERRFEIEGRTLRYPARFQDASSAVGLFLVSSRAADDLIRESGFVVAEVLPGRAVFSLSCVHYRESDCGAYEEIALGFFVKPHGRRGGLPYLGTWRDILRDRAATHVWKLPVTTRLANDAGVQMWGLPKTIEEIDFEQAGGRAAFTLRMDGRRVLRYGVRARGGRRQPRSVSSVYSTFEGAPHVTALAHTDSDMGVSIRGGHLLLGEHPLADQLRGLGLPRRPLLASWIGHVALDVGAPQRL
jgi:hypothetical protein